jgi:hypothetical protein
MATLNKKKPTIKARTHEGAPAYTVNAEKELRRTVSSCLLWEDAFYEDGKSISDRITTLIPQINPETVAGLAFEARTDMNLRHVPLLLVREMARLGSHKHLVAETLELIIQRPDELGELLSIYWKDGRCPVSAQIKKGLARAFTKFSGYSLAKYNRDTEVKLRDVLFISHAKPIDMDQKKLWKKLIDGKLEIPDTWEVSISACTTQVDKKKEWTRLLKEDKIGALALLRNLRNMSDAGVSRELVCNALENMNTDRVLPFRFIAAAKEAPDFEESIDGAFLRWSNKQDNKLYGKTIIMVDISGSMYSENISARSTMNLAQAASALAAILRERCEDPIVYATAGNDYTRIHATKKVPARRGIALTDAVYNLKNDLGGGGIFLKQAIEFVKSIEKSADRIIVITDEQDCAIADKDSPLLATPFGKHNYLVNVANYKHGVGYGKWTHIDGFSESVANFIEAVEKDN